MQMRPLHHRRHGYALPLVLTVLALLGLGFGSVIFVLTSSVSETRRVQGNLRAFYACDSAIRIASAVAQNVVLANPKLTPEEVSTMAMDAVCQTAGSCLGTRTSCPSCTYRASDPGLPAGPDALMPDTANMELFSLRVFPMVSSRAIQFGAFRDLNALQSLVAISTQGVDLATGTVASARDSFSVASISPFQLMAFSTAPLSWAPLGPRPAPSSTTSMGRLGPSVYAGGALSLNSGGGTRLDLLRAVAVGSLSGAGSTRIWDANVGTPGFLPLTGPDERRAFSIRTPLKLIATPGRTPGQPPAEAPTSARWLLDPPGPADNEAAIQAKLAAQADIRIIDGVWFIKPPPDDTVTPPWPGIPVWSDRAGNGVRPSTLEEQTLMSADPASPGVDLPDIGQQDLATRHSWPSTPRRFSYYEADGAGRRVETGSSGGREGVGVVSYGALSVRGGRLLPGFFSSGNGGPSIGPVCVNGANGFSRFLPFDENCRASDPGRSVALGLMEGARQGFRDVSAAQAAPQSPPAMHPNVLPMNLDVAQLLEALLDGRKGELGSYFCGVADATNPAPGCRAFNGIVYVTATWPGALKGLVDAAVPDRAPLQGSEAGIVEPLQPPGTFQNRRYWLPRQLCGAKGLEHTTLSPRSHDGAGVFPIVGCDPTTNSPFQRAYVEPSGPRAGVNALRIINGRDLSALLNLQPLADGSTRRGRLGRLGGLTIVSSLPVYVYGDWNVVPGPTIPDPALVCPTTGALPAGCGFPLTLVGGDRLTFQSRVGACHPGNPGFNDSCSRWTDGGGGSTSASQTFYFGAFMSGLSPTVPRENVEKLFRVMEHWPTTGANRATLNVVGSMFAVGRSIYQPEPQRGSPAPVFDWRFQNALSGLDQPPGAPRFVVGVTSRWRDLR
jgi:hypothetical protein